MMHDVIGRNNCMKVTYHLAHYNRITRPPPLKCPRLISFKITCIIKSPEQNSPNTAVLILLSKLHIVKYLCKVLISTIYKLFIITYCFYIDMSSVSNYT